LGGEFVSELGQLLKNARLEKKISLDDLQETTKIRKRYLEAIEEGNYKVLPGSFYVRAFIKSYAEAVGLDPNEVLKLYQNFIPSTEPEPVTQPIRKKRASSRNADRMSRWISSLVMVSFILLILGILYYYAYNNAKTAPQDDKATQNLTNRITNKKEPEAVNPNNAPANNTATGSVYGKQSEPIATPVKEEPAPSKTEVKFVSSDKGKNTDFYTVNAPKVTIQLKTIGDECWVEVSSLENNRKKVLKQQGVKNGETLKNGETVSWDLDTSAFINVGKANAIEITVNGTVIPAGDTPNPKKIEIDLQKM
jgi:cytoskeletal protein RodZ